MQVLLCLSFTSVPRISLHMQVGCCHTAAANYWKCLLIAQFVVCSDIQYTLDPVRKKGSVLFNDTLNTFYLRLYGVRHMVKDHSDSERGNQLPPHRLLFLINSKGSFICTNPQTG